MKRIDHFSLGIALVLCVGAFSNAVGADVEVGIRVGVSRTDNVSLQPSPNEDDEFVYQASPWVNLTHTSPHLDANLRYSFQWLSYDTIASSQSYHMGEGSVTGKFLDESLAVEVGGTRSQALRDPDREIPPGRLPFTNNLVDRDEYFINPRFERDLGGSVTLNANFRVTEGSYDDAQIQDDSSQHGSFSLENYSAGQGLSWALRYEHRETDYEISRAWEYQNASAELGFWANSNLRLFASGGKESPWEEPFNADLEDTFWESGFAYKPGENLSVEFAAGERSFGSSWRGDLDYSFQRGSTTLSYSESPTTTGFDSSSARRNVLDPDDIDEFLDVPGRAERYLSKKLNWNLNINLRRSELSLAVFDEDRSGRIRADGTPLPDEAQRGAQLNLDWQAGARTSFGASGSILQRENSTSGRIDFYQVGLSADYRLGSNTSLSLTYSYNEQQPKGTNVTGQDYVNNIVSLFFIYTMN